MALMISDNEVHLLGPADFPLDFVNSAHPGDYVPVAVCIPPRVWFHKKAHHNRLFLRVCFRAADGNFIPATFVVDTGSPSSLYVGAPARTALVAAGRLLDDEADTEYVDLGVLGRATVQDIPEPRAPANIVGLPLLLKLGLRLDGANPTISGAFTCF